MGKFSVLKKISKRNIQSNIVFSLHSRPIFAHITLLLHLFKYRCTKTLKHGQFIFELYLIFQTFKGSIFFKMFVGHCYAGTTILYLIYDTVHRKATAKAQKGKLSKFVLLCFVMYTFTTAERLTSYISTAERTIMCLTKCVGIYTIFQIQFYRLFGRCFVDTVDNISNTNPPRAWEKFKSFILWKTINS